MLGVGLARFFASRVTAGGRSMAPISWSRGWLVGPAPGFGMDSWPNINFDAERRFDVVRFNHVLEHIQNPLGELQHAREIVASDGILLVGVPNLSGVTNRLKHWQSRSVSKAEAVEALWCTPASVVLQSEDTREARADSGF